jgi:hypothetical protein
VTQPARQFALPLNILEVTPESVVERLSYRMRRMVGPGQQWSYCALSARSCIDVRTLKAYVQGTACPNLAKYKRLLAVLGPEVGTELNAMKGWLPRSDAVPPEAVDLVELQRELMRVGEVITDVLGIDSAEQSGTKANVDEDGRLDDPVVQHASGAPQHFRRALRIEEVDTRAVADRLSYRLRMMIGPDREWRMGEVSGRTGIDRRTLQSYLDGNACPNLARFLRLSYLLGPEIGVELAYMIGWEPRFSIEQTMRRSDVENLRDAVNRMQGAIEQILDHAPRSHRNAGRLLRRGDQLDDDAQRTDVSVIPFRPQM